MPGNHDVRGLGVISDVQAKNKHVEVIDAIDLGMDRILLDLVTKAKYVETLAASIA